jgi:NitT/TauT family transport system substrate-binding protein
MPFFPLELIPVLGIDRELGARVAIRYFPSGVLAAEDMLLGNADFCGIAMPIFPRVIARSGEMRAFAVLAGGTPSYALIVRKALAGKITSVAKMRGYSIGVHVGSAANKTLMNLMAEQWAARHGIKNEDVRWTPIAQNFEGVSGALAGEVVDAVFCEEPVATSVVRAGLGVRLAGSDDAKNPFFGPGQNHLRAVLAASPKVLEAQPEKARIMVQMLRRSLKWVREASPRAKVPERLGIVDPAMRKDIAQVLDRLPNYFSRDARFSATDVEATRAFMRAAGIEMADGRDVAALIEQRWVK